MSKQGRWSADDQRAASPIVPGTPPVPLEPPPELDEIERVIWRGIVAKLPPDRIEPDSAPLLKEMVRHIRIADEVMGELASVRARLAAVRAESGPVAKRTKAEASLMREYNSLVNAHGYQSERIGNLGTKLRMTNQTKLLVGSKAVREREPEGPEPWTDWTNEPAARN